MFDNVPNIFQSEILQARIFFHLHECIPNHHARRQAMSLAHQRAQATFSGENYAFGGAHFLSSLKFKITLLRRERFSF